MPADSNDPQALPVIDDTFHDEVLRGLERDNVPIEFVKLLEADVVPTGVAVRAHYGGWMTVRVVPICSSPATRSRAR
jgi:hypothetical protein